MIGQGGGWDRTRGVRMGRRAWEEEWIIDLSKTWLSWSFCAVWPTRPLTEWETSISSPIECGNKYLCFHKAVVNTNMEPSTRKQWMLILWGVKSCGRNPSSDCSTGKNASCKAPLKWLIMTFKPIREREEIPINSGEREECVLHDLQGGGLALGEAPLMATMALGARTVQVQIVKYITSDLAVTAFLVCTCSNSRFYPYSQNPEISHCPPLPDIKPALQTFIHSSNAKT